MKVGGLVIIPCEQCGNDAALQFLGRNADEEKAKAARDAKAPYYCDRCRKLMEDRDDRVR